MTQVYHSLFYAFSICCIALSLPPVFFLLPLHSNRHRVGRRRLLDNCPSIIASFQENLWMENVSGSNCQYVLGLPTASQSRTTIQAVMSQPNPNPTYISHNMIPGHVGLIPVPSTSSSVAFPGSDQLDRSRNNAYVAQTLEDLMKKRSNVRKPKSSGPYGRQQIPINNHADLIRFNSPSRSYANSSHSRSYASSSHSIVKPQTRRKVADRLLRPDDAYTVFIPKKSLTTTHFNAEIDCKGCSKVFKAAVMAVGVMFGEPAYFVHCVKDCPKYRELNLIRKCDACCLLFINGQSERKHHGEAHGKRIEKPDWMSDQVYRVRSGLRCNTKVSCSACGQFFDAQNSAGKVSYSLEYMIHCIQDCHEYRNLGLVQTCPVCDCKFLNKLSLSQHKIKSKH